MIDHLETIIILRIRISSFTSEFINQNANSDESPTTSRTNVKPQSPMARKLKMPADVWARAAPAITARSTTTAIKVKLEK